MDVSPRTFRKLYELVVQKLLAEFEGHDKGHFDTKTYKVWTRCFIEEYPQDKLLFEVKYGDLHEQMISRVLLGMDVKGTYFYLAYKRAENSLDSVDIKFDRLYKALLYLEHTKPLSIDEIKAFQNIPETKMRSEVSDLLKEFERLHFPDDVIQGVTEAAKVAGNDALEKFFLTNEIVKFKPQVITDLIGGFFRFLNEHEFFKAWGLLTPKLQKESIWDGDFDRFRWTFMGMNDCMLDSMFDFSYQHERVTMRVTYIETGERIDLPDMIRAAEDESEHYDQQDDDEYVSDMEDIEKAIKLLQDNHDIDFYRFSHEAMHSYSFSRLFFGYLSPSNGSWGYQPKGSYKTRLTTVFSCQKYEGETWLIDGLGAFEPNPALEFIQEISLPV